MEDKKQRDIVAQRIAQIREEIEQRKDVQVKGIYAVKSIAINDLVNLENVYLVELESEEEKLEYELYNLERRIGKSNEYGMIDLDEDYIEQINEKIDKATLKREYHIPENHEINPQDLNVDKEYEQKEEKHKKHEEPKLENQDKQEELKKQEAKKTVDKMEEDLGCDVTSCMKIKDENFSKNVLGHQTGTQNKYLAYCHSRNTFIIVEEAKGKYYEISDLCAAQGGQATKKVTREYDEKGNLIEGETPTMIMQRRDGKPGAVAIDIKYGEICISELTPDPKNQGKFVKQEIEAGHTIKPTTEEVYLAKKEEEKQVAIAEKEAKIAALKEEQRKIESPEDDETGTDNPGDAAVVVGKIETEVEQTSEEVEQLEATVPEDLELDEEDGLYWDGQGYRPSH